MATQNGTMDDWDFKAAQKLVDGARIHEVGGGYIFHYPRNSGRRSRWMSARTFDSLFTNGWLSSKKDGQAGYGLSASGTREYKKKLVKG